MYSESTWWAQNVLAHYRVVRDGFSPSRCLDHQTLNCSLNRKVRSSKEMCHITIHDNLLCASCFLPHSTSWFHNLSVKKHAPSASGAQSSLKVRKWTLSGG